MSFRIPRTARLCVAAFLPAFLATACPGASGKGELGEGVLDGFDTPDGAGPQAIPCIDSFTCPQGMQCDTAAHVCVFCLLDSDCAKGYRCIDGECRKGTECGDGNACAPPMLCDPESGVCVGCLKDIDCPADHLCKAKECVAKPKTCGSGGSCPAGTVCDPATNLCVGCLDDADCPEGSYCLVAAKECKKQVCNPGAKECVGDTVMTCNHSGSAWDPFKKCKPGTQCQKGACVAGCTPSCEGKQCGSDGCGGSCGSCAGDEACVEGACKAWKQCGWAVGTCMFECEDAFEVCAKDCGASLSAGEKQEFDALIQCVLDNCQASGAGLLLCLTKASTGKICQGQYKACKDCEPSCKDKQCGPDGCGGICGECISPATCVDFQCKGVCKPDCAGKQCGPDGCGGQCGECEQGANCESGKCVAGMTCAEGLDCLLVCSAMPDQCLKQCLSLMSPEDAKAFKELYACVQGYCGSSVGGMPIECWQKVASPYGPCAAQAKQCGTCIPQCAGKQCGDDGCGGSCGKCPEGSKCSASGTCNASGDGCSPLPGPGCGGCKCEKCVCSMDPFCCAQQWDDACAEECVQCGGCGCIPTCTFPDGTKKECGPDGCGNACGVCKPGYGCTNGKCSGGGGMSCMGGIECMQGCGGDQACTQKCWLSMSPEAQNQLQALANCVQNWCANLPDSQMGQCIQQNCWQEYQACVGGCEPNCWIFGGMVKECGDDGCGGSCGTCDWGLQCVDGMCGDQPPETCGQAIDCILGCTDEVCANQCISGLGSTEMNKLMVFLQCAMGVCEGGGIDLYCLKMAMEVECKKEYAICAGACVPDCSGKQCGSDGCGGTCGSCPSGQYCDGWGMCVGGGSTCAQEWECAAYGCYGPLQDCMYKCSDATDPSGGALVPLVKCVLGVCPEGFQGPVSPECIDMAIQWECYPYYEQCVYGCTPYCQGKQCGDDGCGGSCGECPEGCACSASGQCQCQPMKFCMDIYQCAMSCPTLSQTCISDCMDGASSYSKGLFADIAKCVIGECGLPPSKDCIQKAVNGACYQDYVTCKMDGSGIGP